MTQPRTSLNFISGQLRPERERKSKWRDWCTWFRWTCTWCCECPRCCISPSKRKIWEKNIAAAHISYVIFLLLSVFILIIINIWFSFRCQINSNLVAKCIKFKISFAKNAEKMPCEKFNTLFWYRLMCQLSLSVSFTTLNLLGWNFNKFWKKLVLNSVWHFLEIANQVAREYLLPSLFWSMRISTTFCRTDPKCLFTFKSRSVKRWNLMLKLVSQFVKILLQKIKGYEKVWREKKLIYKFVLNKVLDFLYFFLYL